MYKKVNANGFTLIELISVIVILGILMLVAVPGVSSHVLNSKKQTYIRTLNSYVESVKYDVMKGRYKLKEKDEIRVNFSSISVDSGSSSKSPFGTYNDIYSYVTVIKNNDSTYTYKIQALDSAGYYIENIDIQLLSESDISKTDVNDGNLVIPNSLKPNN